MTTRLLIATDHTREKYEMVQVYGVINNNIKLHELHTMIGKAQHFALDDTLEATMEYGEHGIPSGKFLLTVVEYLRIKKECTLILSLDRQVKQFHLDQSPQCDRIMLIPSKNNWLAHTVVRRLEKETGVSYDMDTIIEALEDYKLIYLDTK